MGFHAQSNLKNAGDDTTAGGLRLHLAGILTPRPPKRCQSKPEQ